MRRLRQAAVALSSEAQLVLMDTKDVVVVVEVTVEVIVLGIT